MELQWPLIIFNTLVAWSAGVFGTQGALASGGHACRSQMPLLAISVALLAVSGIAVFFHLEHWERIFNGFGHLSSGITQEFIVIVVFAVVAVAYFVFLRRSGDGTVPRWMGWLAVAISTVLVVVCAHSYVMAARPAWNSVLEVLSLVGAALLMGPATCGVVMALRKDAGAGAREDGVADVADGLAAADAAAGFGASDGEASLRASHGAVGSEVVARSSHGARAFGRIAVIGATVGALCVLSFAVFLQMSGGSFVDVGYHFDPVRPTQAMVDPAAVVAIQAPLLWAGGVVVGAFVPLALCWLAVRKGTIGLWKACGSTAVLCALVGAVCLRVAFYNLGLSVFMFY